MTNLMIRIATLRSRSLRLLRSADQRNRTRCQRAIQVAVRRTMAGWGNARLLRFVIPEAVGH